MAQRGLARYISGGIWILSPYFLAAVRRVVNVAGLVMFRELWG